MSKTYVDNAYNRSAGRVGMAHGSAVISSGSSGSRQSSNYASYSSGSTASSNRSYVDNAYNSSVGRVGLEVGSMVISKNNSSSTQSNHHSNEKTYADNSFNRSVGRVGLDIGSMVISKNNDSSTQSSPHSNEKTYADNSFNRSVGRVGLDIGSMVISKNNDSSTQSSPHSNEKTYADNSFNRSVGRVGLEVGSMVISKNSDSSTKSSPHSNEITYADNSFNRRAGRVGLEVGSMVISKNSDSSTKNSPQPIEKTYADNSFNRRAGRVGLEVGSMVISKNSDSSTKSSPHSNEKTYADNSFNRRAGRVGLEVGSMVISKNNDSPTQGNHQILKKSQKTKIQEEKRMGAEADNLTENNKSKKIYKDNAFNRRHGRVGLPLGSKPLRKKVEVVSLHTFPYEELCPQLNDYSGYDIKLQEIIQNLMDRRAIENNLALKSQELFPIKTLQSFANISGRDVAYEELELIKKIGSGGFGEVYLSKWNNAIVAVKKLRLQKISKNRLKDFTKEVTNYYTLNHPNVVKFLGACTVTPNLCIIMEYMDMSLFEAKIDIDFSEEERLRIISQVCKGLLYLHEKGIAHCDLKTQNILLRYNEKENVCVAKICDFGLSIIKHNTETSGSSIEQYYKNIGTPRYSAPEVLRGELIAASAWFMCDIYSLSLIFFEIIYEEEPFNNLSYAQLQKQVGENGLTPDIPSNVSVDQDISNLMKACWKFSPVQRPKINEIEKKVNHFTRIYCD
ncbi:dual specificity protein kinase splB [Hydra vulgaris]|uniref:dual specificity protein kinase splB n=1 Tax=Hydra vulgaris TaxID=6087 RepID=UPI001F5FED2D|nr:dual specificity protein kinase splB isoform X1 [Hydra vulgaris]XP_012555324.2 dual specificity protein kinase splB isoform X1 [Hydra vulgaris]XP_047143739.1 dual specificity protein kinase splB isoform X1 [Hydra vulgaris]XP_047143740.1 dual specificity protein kinase splB isoform X1 [Hydra vulgaris]XP_047143741.1 dual specificity protein kinase splB isoform X1 [Hydra vulgaris]